MRNRSNQLLRIVLTILPVFTILLSEGSLGISADAADVQITAPESEVMLEQGESLPAQRPIAGRVTGVTAAEIKQGGLRVTVSIRTDKWYPQGIGRVHDDGSWRVNGYFGGSTHTIRAVLKNSSGVTLAETTKVVNLIQ